MSFNATFNVRGAFAIFKNELMRMFRTIFGSIL
jgi:ABC-2 type transport system permease protein